MEVEISENHFLLLPQRAVLWKEKQALILSDLHFGKTTHFRKAGIPVPEVLFQNDLATLDFIVNSYSPQSIIIVGDMFHSHHNAEVEKFAEWRSSKAALEIHLVLGNHDILSVSKYQELKLQLSDIYVRDGFTFTHEPLPRPSSFNFSGHIHPGIRLEGPARQSLKFPCFYFTQHGCVLPAFSKFTGLSIVNPVAGDRAYAIVENEVLPY
ncbi:MAG: ligase-associated DNA damage response endonuclease PdeM [Chitinophagales bacterium]